MVYEPPLNRTSEIDGLCMEIAEPAPRECRSGSQGPQREGHGTARIRETRQVVVEPPFLPFLSPAATPTRQSTPMQPPIWRPIWRHFIRAFGGPSSPGGIRSCSPRVQSLRPESRSAPSFRSESAAQPGS